MLRALARWILRNDAPTTQPRRVERVERGPDLVTRDELDAALKKFEERFEWEMSEWYDKFSTLHARASKRVERAAQQGKPKLVAEQPALPSALHHRRFGSP